MATTQRLTFENLRDYLSAYREKRRRRSVPTPPAQSRTLLQPDEHELSQIVEQVHKILLNSSVPLPVRAVLELQMLYGLRVSECLNIECSDVSSSGHIRVKGAKGSENRVVIPNVFKKFWQTATPSTLPIKQVFSRFYFYRTYKNLGLYFRFNNSKVLSVTHFFRHYNILSLKANFNDTSLTQKFIGHKSIKSTKHYEKK